jgi:hypothetical protein
MAAIGISYGNNGPNGLWMWMHTWYVVRRLYNVALMLKCRNADMDMMLNRKINIDYNIS